MAIVTCENCDGEGVVTEDFHDPSNHYGHGERQLVCGECEGEGEIDCDCTCHLSLRSSSDCTCDCTK